MSRGKIISKLSTKTDLIGIYPSRCLRMRFNKSRCSKCVDCCPAGAISLKNGLGISKETCTECMLCVAECPSGGLEIPSLNFYSLISKLRKISHPPQSPLTKGVNKGGLVPVIACSMKEDLDAHVKTFCMGFLSEEHLTAIMVFLKEPLQINLTGCKDCKNGFIVDVLKKRLESVLSKTALTNSYMLNEASMLENNVKADKKNPPSPPFSKGGMGGFLNKIILVEDKSALQYQTIPYDRRGFFGALKILAMEGAANFVENPSTQKNTQAFSEKVLPFKRRLLNKALSVILESNIVDNDKKTFVSKRDATNNDVVGGLSNRILANYYYDLIIDGNCDMCFACTGMCPTGAIKNNEDSKQENEPYELLFYSYLCNRCGLCSDFCMQSSISIKQGFSGNPFEEKCVKKEND